MRGVYNDDVVIDEPGQIDPRAWPEVIRPTLSDFNGRATFIGTVRGKDWFHRVDRDESDKELPSWFRLTLRASETGILPRSELDAARADMSEEQYAREYECSILAGVEGAYFSKLLAKAEQEGRITALAVDPLLPLRAYWDIGGAGAKADACCIWIVQFVGQQINVLDYCEGVGQVLAFYVNWLRKNDYERAECVLPHDGIVTNNVTGKTYESHLREAQFSTRVIPNQGPGAAAMRIEAIRRLGPKLWFNAKTTEAGRDALGFYHERRDSQRNIGLGPDHDWSSHAADAFGMMAVTYVEPASSAKFWRKLDDYRPAVTVA
jgi:hypothetical protein